MSRDRGSDDLKGEFQKSCIVKKMFKVELDNEEFQEYRKEKENKRCQELLHKLFSPKRKESSRESIRDKINTSKELREKRQRREQKENRKEAK